MIAAGEPRAVDLTARRGLELGARTLALGVQYREATVETRADGSPDVDEEARTVALSFSSEEPVARYWGTEILDHGSGACDLAELRDGRAPLLLDHNPRDQVGVIESARIVRRRGRAVVRFGRSARAEEVFRDVVDGIRSRVSVGYYVQKAVLESTSGDDGDVYRVLEWRPVEISIVALAADPTVGVGRAVSIPADPTVGIGRSGREPMTEPISGRESGNARERKRIREIEATAAHWQVPDEVVRRAIDEEWSEAHFRSYTLENHVPKSRPLAVPPSAIGIGERTSIGIGGRELARYSVLRLARAHATKDFREAGLEIEASDEVAKKLGRSPRGSFVPYEVLTAPVGRAVEKGGTASGAALVETELRAESFVELLRHRTMVRALGATMLPGLVGDVDVPRQSGAASAAWLGEGGTVTATDSTYDAVSLTPKTVGGRTNITRKMLLQGTPAIEMLVRTDLATVLALAVDLAATFGTASGNQPRGIVNTVGIGSVSFGATVGGAPTWPLIVQLESEVANDNADQGALGYLTNSRVRGKMKTVEKAASTGLFLWEQPPGTPEGFGLVNGYRAAVSNQIPSNLVEGGSGAVLSAIIFGDWSSLLIGEWGVLDVTADPYALGDSGGVVLRGFYDVDVAVRHPESFAVATDVSTV